MDMLKKHRDVTEHNKIGIQEFDNANHGSVGAGQSDCVLHSRPADRLCLFNNAFDAREASTRCLNCNRATASGVAASN
jgi:hypothetical protein